MRESEMADSVCRFFESFLHAYTKHILLHTTYTTATYTMATYTSVDPNGLLITHFTEGTWRIINCSMQYSIRKVS